MKPNDFTIRRFLRPSLLVPVIIVAAAALPAVLAGGCGSSTSSSNDTSQFTSLPTTPVTLTLDWPDLETAPPTPNPTPSPTPSPTPTPDPSATPTFSVLTTPAGSVGLAVPRYALSAVVTLSSADPSNGSVLLLPVINRDDAKPLAYSQTYVSALKARIGTTNANVRFFDSKNGWGNVLADYTKLALTINADGTGLNTNLPTIPATPTPPPTPTPTPTPNSTPTPTP